jgi:hypothetical protein
LWKRRLGKAAGKRGESDGDSARSLFFLKMCVFWKFSRRKKKGKPPLTFSLHHQTQLTAW